MPYSKDESAFYRLTGRISSDDEARAKISSVFQELEISEPVKVLTSQEQIKHGQAKERDFDRDRNRTVKRARRSSTKMVVGEGSARRFIHPSDITILIPATVFLTAFAKSFGAKLGEMSGDSVGKLFSSWVSRLHKTKPDDENITVYLIHKKKLKIELPRDLPPEAYDELNKLLEHTSRRTLKEADRLIYHPEHGWVFALPPGPAIFDRVTGTVDTSSHLKRWKK
jgi:hypothetical protein